MTTSAVPTKSVRTVEPQSFTQEISAEHSSTQRVSSTWKGGLASTVTVRDHTFDVDAPVSSGGTDTASSPMEIIAGAVESCITIVITARAAELGIELDGVNTYAIVKADDRGLAHTADVQPYYHYFRLQLVVSTAETDEAKLTQLTEFVERTCPALNLVKDANTTVDVAWAFVEAGTDGAGAAEYLSNEALEYEQRDADLVAPQPFFVAESTKIRTAV